MSRPRYNSEGHLPYESEPYNHFNSDTYGAPPTHPQSPPGQYVPFSHRHSESSASGASANDYFAHPTQFMSPHTSYNGFAPTPDSGYSSTPSMGTPLASPDTGMPSRYRRPVSGNYAKPAYTPLRYNSGLGPDQPSQQPRNRPVSYQHPPVISAGTETSAFQESIDTLVEQSYRQQPYIPSVPDLAFYDELKSMDNPNNSQPQPTPMSSLKLEGTIPYHGGWLPGRALVEDPIIDKEAHGEIQPLNVKKNPGIQITVDDVVKEVENLKVTDEAPGPGFEASRNSEIGDPNVDTNSEIYVGSDDELVDSELEVEDPVFNYRTWKPFREFDWSALGEDEHERVDELCEKLVDATSWKKKADIALEIMRPILEYGDEMLSVRGWVEGEVRQIFREAEEFPTGRVFDPTRYIANEEYDKGYVAKSASNCGDGREGEGRGGGKENEGAEEKAENHEGDHDITESIPEVCDHDNCACWFEVTPEAGIRGFPSTSRHRKAAVEYIHSFISELLMRLLEYGSETELFTMDYEIDLETLMVHVGGDEARWDEDEFDTEDEVDDDEDDEDNVDERIVALEAHTTGLTIAQGITENYSDDDNGDENHEGDELNDGTSERKGCADGCDCGEHEGHEGNNADEEDDDEEDDDEEDNDEEDNDEYVATPRSLQFCKLVGILSCRAVALTICRNGKGQFFAKQENLEYWDFGEMVEKYAEQNPVLPWDHLQRSRVARLDMDRYPTRVINTETLEFETDPTLFKNKYCILSHMWQKDEVTYDTVKKVWAKYKEQQLETKIADLTRKVIEQRSKLDQAREDGVLGPKQLKEIEDKISHSEGEKRLLKRELESLIKAREKEEAAKKTGKDGIRRQPSTRRPAGVNPQPTGDLVGLGIKRSLTKRGTALGEGKSSGTTAGERKLMNAIRTARKLEFTYLWCDQVCINKQDPSEVAENISSMGDYYANAQACLVYLHDVDRNEHGKGFNITPIEKVYYTQWATRGWTLQEIVMCPRAIFFNHGWKALFDSSKEKRTSQLGKLCRVPRSLLWHGRKPDVSASTILSLSAKRKTTRPEDRAYCLMGILGVRMTADYGEGQEKAMYRLMEMIVRNNSDVSIFNWTGFYAGNKQPGKSMFANDFGAFSDQKVYPLEKPLRSSSEITFGHSGVHARFEIWEPNLVFENDNEQALNTLNQLDTWLKDPDQRKKSSLNCAVNVTFVVDDPDIENIEVRVFCPRELLRKQLEIECIPGEPEYLDSNWCLARFAGVEGSKWFVVQLKYEQNQYAKKNMFAHMFTSEENSGVTGRSGGSEMFLHYVESRGFWGRRLPTEEFDADGIPSDETRMVNLWIG